MSNGSDNGTRALARGVSPLTRALAMAGDGLSGTLMLGLTGALAALGHDGLAFISGIAGGWLIAMTLIAPHLQRAGHLGPVMFVARRFGSVTAVAAGGVLVLATLVLVAAELTALAMPLRLLLGVDAPTGVAIAAALTLVVALAARSGAVTGLQALLFVPLAAALMLPVLLPALASAGVPVPQLAYGAVLQAISDLELKRLGEELADPVSLKAYLRPFTTMTPSATVMLTLSMALGLAAMPRLLMRPVQAGSAHQARWVLAVGFVLLLLALLALPPLAAAVRHGSLETLVGREPGRLDPWLFDLGRAGLARVCGVAAVSADAVSAACAALPEAPERLRLDDIDIARDALLLALPGLGGLPSLVTHLLAAAVALAALAAAAWLAVALRDDVAGVGVRPPPLAEHSAGETSDAPPLWRRMLALVLVLAAIAGAAAFAATDPADLATLVAWGLAVAAAGLTPALVAGIWWQRATAAGAFAGIVCGVALTVYYIVATRYFAIGFYETWSGLSNAGFGAVADFEAARDALAAATGEDRAAALAELDAAARRAANWFGIRSIGAGVLGAGAGTLVLLLVSAVTPRPGPSARLLVERMRTQSHGG